MVLHQEDTLISEKIIIIYNLFLLITVFLTTYVSKTYLNMAQLPQTSSITLKFVLSFSCITAGN